ncbi:MAG: hypothetical protein ACFN26_03765, partial [Kingella denitrificans]
LRELQKAFYECLEGTIRREEGVAEWEAIGADLRFTPLPDVHFVSDVQFDNMPKAKAASTPPPAPWR